MKTTNRRTVYIVKTTTQSGADYAVQTGFSDRTDAVKWEHKNRDNYPRELWIEKIKF